MSYSELPENSLGLTGNRITERPYTTLVLSPLSFLLPLSFFLSDAEQSNQSLPYARRAL